MDISAIALLALTLSGGCYLYIAWGIHRRALTLDDQLPLTTENKQARVRNSKEFSSATVATTISLATVILAYAELAGYMGTWLFWTVITTSVGILVVRFAAPIIWRKLASRGPLRPTLHEFLGDAYDSGLLVKGAALCTSLGFIGALAVELTVASRFLVGLVPSLPTWLALVLLCGIGVGYTMLGGFRAVVLTDQIQMLAIWLAVIALGLLIVHGISSLGGISVALGNVPATVFDFSWREGLGAFLVGIAIINIPTFLGDMSIWQRIAASTDETTVRDGLRGSVVSALLSWGALAAIACALVSLVVPKDGENPLLTFLLQEAATGKLVIGGLLFVTITGLYGASLSTASTQLIAAGHSIHTDLLRATQDRGQMAVSRVELTYSRIILAFSAIIAILIVEGLRILGFSIADLVFAVYGSQLGLVPVVIAAISLPETRLKMMGSAATTAILGGFAAGWGSATFGKWAGNGDLVFLAPAASLGVSTALVLLGLVVTRTSPRSSGLRRPPQL